MAGEGSSTAAEELRGQEAWWRAQVHIRNSGWFHVQLWDDMLADLQPLAPSDVLLVNYGAWYAAPPFCT
jgi:hypothetical protein